MGTTETRPGRIARKHTVLRRGTKVRILPPEDITREEELERYKLFEGRVGVVKRVIRKRTNLPVGQTRHDPLYHVALSPSMGTTAALDGFWRGELEVVDVAA